MLLVIFYGKEVSLRSKLAGTVDNKAGYGDPEAARRIGRWTKSLLDMGFTRSIEHLRYNVPTPQIVISWLICKHPGYPDSYAEARFEIGNDNFMDIQRGAKFLKGLGLRIGRSKIDPEWDQTFNASDLNNSLFNDPATVIKTLDAMGAKKVRRIQGVGEHHWSSELVQDPSPRPWLLTDTLFSIFGY